MASAPAGGTAPAQEAPAVAFGDSWKENKVEK